MPPLSPNEMNEIVRRVSEAMRPVKARLDAHSGEMKAVRAEIREEISPAVLRRMAESDHEIDERSASFERLIMNSVTATRQEVSDLRNEVSGVAKSIAPAAMAAKGAESAAVAGAQAMVRAEGKQDAVQVAADRADKNSLAARVRSNQTMIVLLLGIVIQAAYAAWQHIAHAVTP